MYFEHIYPNSWVYLCCPSRLKNGATPGVWPTYKVYIVKEHWLTFSHQLYNIKSSPASGGILCTWFSPLHWDFVWDEFSGLSLFRSCTCRYNHWDLVQPPSCVWNKWFLWRYYLFWLSQSFHDGSLESRVGGWYVYPIRIQTFTVSCSLNTDQLNTKNLY